MTVERVEDLLAGAVYFRLEMREIATAALGRERTEQARLEAAVTPRATTLAVDRNILRVKRL